MYGNPSGTAYYFDSGLIPAAGSLVYGDGSISDAWWPAYGTGYSGYPAVVAQITGSTPLSHEWSNYLAGYGWGPRRTSTAALTAARPD